MTPYNLMYYGLQASLFVNGLLAALALRRAALAGSGAVVALTAVSFVAAPALMLFAPPLVGSHDGGLGYQVCTAASRFCIGLCAILPLALSRWRWGACGPRRASGGAGRSQRSNKSLQGSRAGPPGLQTGVEARFHPSSGWVALRTNVRPHRTSAWHLTVSLCVAA